MIGHKSEHDTECSDHRSEPTGESRPRFADGTQRTHLQPRDDGIVHDLRGPLATINLEASLLEDQIELVGGPSTRRALQRIRLNVDYLARMVDDLLDLTAIDRGRLTIRNARTELRTLLEQVIERAITTRDRDRVVLEAPKPITVSADDLRIERVVANLIQNALKYAPSRSAIVVRLDGGATVARISVIDAGPGIAPEERESIFEAFYRSASTSPQDGSGLGLYVSKRIVEAHGGRIGVDRAPDRGSCFFFELPVT